MLLRFHKNILVAEVLGDLMRMFNRKGTKTQSSAKSLDTLAVLSAIAALRLNMRSFQRSSRVANEQDDL